MYKLTIYIPETHLELVKQSLFAAGAGHVGNYDSCCWQVKGEGQCRLKHLETTDNSHVDLTKVVEWRVEMSVEDDKLAKVITALKMTHPYELPAYDVIKVVDV